MDIDKSQTAPVSLSAVMKLATKVSIIMVTANFLPVLYVFSTLPIYPVVWL